MYVKYVSKYVAYVTIYLFIYLENEQNMGSCEEPPTYDIVPRKDILKKKV